MVNSLFIKVTSLYLTKLISYSRLLFLLLLLLTTNSIIPTVFAASFANETVTKKAKKQAPSQSQWQKKNDSKHANVDVKLSQNNLNNLTPGQQLSLVIEVSYRNDVEIFLEPSQYNWHPFTLVNHSKSAPRWFANQKHNNQWQVNYIVDVIVPLAGNYHLPEMTLHSYWQQQHQSLFIEGHAITVNSSFPDKEDAIKLQAIERMSPLVNKASNTQYFIAIIITIIFIFLVIISVKVFVQQKRRSQTKQQDNNESRVLLPAELIAKAKNSSEYDWEALRQCMLQHMDFDPLDKQINIQNLTLSNQYISARFSANNKASFIKICQVCHQTSIKKRSNTYA